MSDRYQSLTVAAVTGPDICKEFHFEAEEKAFAKTSELFRAGNTQVNIACAWITEPGR